MHKRLQLIPPRGRDYETPQQVLADLESRKDFIAPGGRIVNVDDAIRTGYTGVCVHYNDRTSVAIVNFENDIYDTYIRLDQRKHGITLLSSYQARGLILDPDTREKLMSFRGDDTDAGKWASLFSRVFAQNPSAAADEGYLLSIFSSAIMAGKDSQVRALQGRTCHQKLD